MELEFETINNSEIVWWAMRALVQNLEELSERGRDLILEGEKDRASGLKVIFLDRASQYLEIFKKTYAEEAHKTAEEIVRNLFNKGWY